MFAKFALLTLASFALGVVVPLPETALVKQSSTEQLVETQPEPEFTVVTTVVDGCLVMAYKDSADAAPPAVSKSDSAPSENRRAELADLQSKDVI